MLVYQWYEDGVGNATEENSSLIKISRPTWHKIGHSGDAPQANLLAWYGKTKT